MRPRPGPFDDVVPDELSLRRLWRQDLPAIADEEDPDPPPPDPDHDCGSPDGSDPPPEPPPERPPAPSDGPGAVSPPKDPVRIRVLRIDPLTGYALPDPGLRLDYGTDRRLFPPALKAYLCDLYRTCAIPGCPHHNRTTRNRPGWVITPHGDGTATLTTPMKKHYSIAPYDYLA